MGWQLAEKGKDYPGTQGITYRGGKRFVDIKGKQDCKEFIKLDSQSGGKPTDTVKQESANPEAETPEKDKTK